MIGKCINILARKSNNFTHFVCDVVCCLDVALVCATLSILIHIKQTDKIFTSHSQQDDF